MKKVCKIIAKIPCKKGHEEKSSTETISLMNVIQRAYWHKDSKDWNSKIDSDPQSPTITLLQTK